MRAVSSLLLSLLPAVVWACPVCGQARSEEVNATYVAMTVFMSLTPLLMIFGLAFFVVRKIRQAERAEAAASQPVGESASDPASAS